MVIQLYLVLNVWPWFVSAGSTEEEGDYGMEWQYYVCIGPFGVVLNVKE